MGDTLLALHGSQNSDPSDQTWVVSKHDCLEYIYPGISDATAATLRDLVAVNGLQPRIARALLSESIDFIRLEAFGIKEDLADEKENRIAFLLSVLWAYLSPRNRSLIGVCFH